MSFESLLSENVMFGPNVYSDTRATVDALFEVEEVKALAGIDSNKAKELIQCINDWLIEPYNRRYRHPKDMAISAGLVVLYKGHRETQEFKDLMASTLKITEPALCMVLMTAEDLRAR